MQQGAIAWGRRRTVYCSSARQTLDFIARLHIITQGPHCTPTSTSLTSPVMHHMVTFHAFCQAAEVASGMLRRMQTDVGQYIAAQPVNPRISLLDWT